MNRKPLSIVSSKRTDHRRAYSRTSSIGRPCSWRSSAQLLATYASTVAGSRTAAAVEASYGIPSGCRSSAVSSSIRSPATTSGATVAIASAISDWSSDHQDRLLELAAVADEQLLLENGLGVVAGIKLVRDDRQEVDRAPRQVRV